MKQQARRQLAWIGLLALIASVLMVSGIVLFSPFQQANNAPLPTLAGQLSNSDSDSDTTETVLEEGETAANTTLEEQESEAVETDASQADISVPSFELPSLILPNRPALTTASGGIDLDAASENSSSSNTLETTQAASPTPSPEPTLPESPLGSLPQQTVPNTVVITFEANTTPQQRQQYIQSIGGTVQQDLTSLHTVVVEVPASVTVETLPESPAVAVSEPDYYVSALAEPTTDTYSSQQWSLDAIAAPQGWAALPADPLTVTVAVIDSGVCLDHMDLRNRIGSGWDFVQNDASPQDEFGHGCGVAGVIAANMNNSIGIAGVAPNTQIMPIRVLDGSGWGTYSDVAAGMVYAVDNGADIINLSLGGANPSTLLENAVNYAASKGVLVVAAAGNSGSEGVFYPARYASVVAVGSVDQNLQRSSFSSYGTEVDLLAPGRDIMTTGSDGNYLPMTGTSLAVPHVTGIAALELATGGQLVQSGGVVAFSGGQVAQPPTPVPTNGGRPDSTPSRAVTPTDQWVVQLPANVNANDVANQLGFVNLGQTAFAGYYIFQIPQTEASRAAAQSAAVALERDVRVLAFEQLVLRQHYSRISLNDPQYANQWHLTNTGQSGGTTGEDIDVVGAWDAGYTGAGVVVAVVDDGLQYTHTDLAGNYSAANSYDYNFNDSNPAPTVSVDWHGTSAAGVVAAIENNNKCGVGVAFDATIAGVRLIAAATTDQQEANAMGNVSASNTYFDISTNSWGPEDSGGVLEGPGLLAAAAIQSAITNGRGGKGAIYVWAGGNGGAADDAGGDGWASSRYTISVTATDYRGDRSWYTERGSGHLVNAPSSGDTLSVTTTDITGTTYGYGGLADGDCTNDFGGTSSAAPTVAGLVALMLDANPDLTWRDVQHILIETADKNDPSDSFWFVNGAGYDVNDYYGFGRVNAAAAVTAATTWTNVPAEQTDTSGTITANLPVAIPSSNSNPGVTRTYTNADSPIDKLEHVEVVFNATHTYRGDIEVILTSPSGTASKLIQIRDEGGDNYSNWTFTSTQFWGENPVGNWTLEVVDRYPAADAGTWTNWRLNFYGTENAPTEIYNIADGDEAGLIAAINAANADGIANTINLATNGTYTLTGSETGSPFVADGNNGLPSILNSASGLDLTINGNGATIQRSSATEFRILHIGTGAEVVLNDVTITGGDATGSLYENAGGGIYLDENSTLALNSSVVRNNIGAWAGGIYTTIGSSLTIDNSQISANSGQNAGGVYAEDATVVIQNGSIIGGTSLAEGNLSTATGIGGLVSSGSNLTIHNSFFQYNQGTVGGALLYEAPYPRILDISYSEFKYNVSPDYAAGINVYTGGGSIHHVVISDNQGSGVNLIGYEANALTVEDTQITNNTSTAAGGGGAYNINFARVVISGNTSDTYSGGLATDGTVSITDSVISNNTALGLDLPYMSDSNEGGGIYNLGTLTVTNTTISGNISEGDGGGIANYRYSIGGEIYLTNVTITNNTTQDGNGGGIFNDSSSTVNIRNSILAGNIDDGGQAPDCAGTLTSQDYNHIGNMTGCTIAGTTTHNVINPTTYLAPLADNGGSTHTHKLLAGSPAIDAANAANCPANDQRGVERGFDANGVPNSPQAGDCDMGAYELDEVVIVNPPAAPSLTAPLPQTNATQPTYTWTDVSGATHYLLQVNHPGNSPIIMQTFSSAEANCNGTTCSVTPAVSLSQVGYYRAWVRASNTAGNSPWSATHFFYFYTSVPTAPTITKPTSPTDNSLPTYTWTDVGSASHYFIQVNNPSGPIFQQTLTAAEANCNRTTCSYTPNVPLTVWDGVHRVWVRGSNGLGNGAWSATHVFTYGAIPTVPSVTEPSVSTTDSTPTYRWTQVPNATSYRLYVSNNDVVEISILYPLASLTCDGSTCAVTPDVVLSPWDSKHWVWVRAVNNAGQSAWSANHTFYYGQLPTAPTVTGPASPTSASQPTYTWTDVGNVTYYRLYVTGPNGIVISEAYPYAESGCDGTTCSLTPPVNLTALGTYRVWVRGINNTGPGAWSPTYFLIKE